jgi:hypothetical protein
MIKKTLTFVLLTIYFYSVVASDKKDTQYSIVPFMAYSNETRLMGGGFLNYQKTLPSSKTNDELSLASLVIYSARHQFQFLLMPKYSLRNESQVLMLNLKGRHWPDTFWGIGNETPDSTEEKYTQEEFQLGLNLEQLVYKKLYLTGHIDYRIENILNKEANGILANENIVGNDTGNHYLGKGLGLRWKSTDSNYYPTRGFNNSLSFLNYTSPENVISSDGSFDIFTFDANYYTSPIQGWVIATQTSFVNTENNIPFSFLPELGSKLRAYNSKRYIDKALIAQRLEQRVFPADFRFMQEKGYLQSKFWKKSGMVVFVEAGQVASHTKQFNLNRNHYSYGLGLRYSIIPQERLNLRMDFGFGKDTMNFIVQGTEAF